MIDGKSGIYMEREPKKNQKHNFQFSFCHNIFQMIILDCFVVVVKKPII